MQLYHANPPDPAQTAAPHDASRAAEEPQPWRECSEQLDVLHVYVLSGISRFNDARELARRLGPDLFDDPSALRVAALVLSDDPLDPDPFAGLTSAECARAERLANAACSTENPHTTGWAIALVRQLAERRWRELLASALEWAAGEIRSGASARRVFRELNTARNIALGRNPLDPSDQWSAAA